MDTKGDFEELDHVTLEAEKHHDLLSAGQTPESQWCNSVRIQRPENQGEPMV